MAEDAAELDAEALLFLEELVVDDDGIIGTQSLPALSTSLPPPPDDAELLSSLLASPPSSSFGNAHGALSFAVAQLEPPLPLEMVLPLDFFPPSDDETDQHPHIRTARTPAATRTTATTTTTPTNAPPPSASATAAAPATNQTTALKTKRKKPNRSANYNPNRARNERRHELIYLKQKVTEMEQELLRLHDKTDSNTTSATTSSSNSTTPLQLAADDVASQQLLYMQPSQLGQLSSSPLDVGVWERIASRQLNERRRAERENERLRIVLETQLKIARSLEHLLHKRTTMQGLEETGLGKQKRVFANSSVRTQSDELIFDELLRQVHACYLDAESHFERMGIGATEVSCRDARIRDSDGDGGSGGMNMEIFANEVLPFELHTAGKAAWQYFSIDKNHLPYRLYYERVRENKSLTEDTIIENSGLELHVNNTKAIFNLKQVLRRYVEPDRVVIAYSALAQPVEFDNKPIWGCDFREYGCMVLKRPATHDPSTHAVLKTCYFIVPEFYGHSADDQDHRVIGELTEFVLSSTAATMAAWLQMIENILVVEHIGNVR